MSGPDVRGRCVLVQPSTAEVEALRRLPGLDLLSPGELEGRLRAPAEPVDLVVVGSLAAGPVALVQRVHRLAPGASIAVLTDDPADVRRQVSYAPGVPLELLVASVAEGDVVERLQQLRDAAAGRRRHAAVLAAVVSRAAVVPAAGAPGPAGVDSLLEHAPIAVLVVAPTGELLGWNRRAERLLDLRQAPVGRSVDEVAPGVLAYLAGLPAQDGPPPGEAHPPAHLRIADRADVELTAVRSQTDDGHPVFLLLVTDVTAHREAERERDRLADQVQLLGRVSETLVASLDVTESMSRLADVLVPALADWTSIQLREDRGQLAGVTVRHRDPAQAALARDVEAVITRNSTGSEASRRAAGGEPVVFPDVDRALLDEQVSDPELRSLVARLGTASALAVPVPGRSGLLGSLLLARGAGRAPLGAGDLELAVEIGRRAGIALDNARLYAGQRHLAAELQRSLLTDPPDVASARIAVRYVAAAREAQVGGDWYDSFRQRSGDLVLVIGDVVGHDTRAAAAMGQLRSLVRGIGFTTAGTPAEVLTAVDGAVEGLQLSTMATAVVAQLALRVDGADGATMRWSNAGHPPPLLVGADGRARLLGPPSGRADLLLGVDPTAPRHVAEATVPAGSTVLLYTDGLVEGRSHTLDEGLDRLVATVERHAGEPLEELCDAVLAELVPRGVRTTSLWSRSGWRALRTATGSEPQRSAPARERRPACRAPGVSKARRRPATGSGDAERIRLSRRPDLVRSRSVTGHAGRVRALRDARRAAGRRGRA